jgi:hypothetical protein
MSEYNTRVPEWIWLYVGCRVCRVTAGRLCNLPVRHACAHVITHRHRSSWLAPLLDALQLPFARAAFDVLMRVGTRYPQVGDVCCVSAVSRVTH